MAWDNERKHMQIQEARDEIHLKDNAVCGRKENEGRYLADRRMWHWGLEHDRRS